MTKSGLLRGTLSASEQLALISGTDKIEEACRDAKHVQVKSLPIETDFKCSLNNLYVKLETRVRSGKSGSEEESLQVNSVCL